MDTPDFNFAINSYFRFTLRFVLFLLRPWCINSKIICKTKQAKHSAAQLCDRTIYVLDTRNVRSATGEYACTAYQADYYREVPTYQPENNGEVLKNFVCQIEDLYARLKVRLDIRLEHQKMEASNHIRRQELRKNHSLFIKRKFQPGV
jgi:hypothetical protein